MRDENAQLNPKILDDDVEKVSMREGFGDGLVLAGEADQRVVALSADLKESTNTHKFAEKYPERYVELGVAEQNMAGVASGMAAMGKITFMASYAVFSPGRNWEQIRTTIAYNDVPVKIIGSHAGVTVGPDGGSHQALEDIALMRSLPRMVVLSPCDAIEAKKATLAAAKANGPVYMRLCRAKTPVMTTEETPFEIGKSRLVWRSESPKAGIIATGWLLSKALKVAQMLESTGARVNVLNLSTIKPLDRDGIIAFAKEAGAIVTVEEHQLAGGMGSAVAELLAETCPVPIEFVAVRDVFGQSGDPDELVERYGLGEKAISEAVRKVISRKNGTS